MAMDIGGIADGSHFKKILKPHCYFPTFIIK